MKPAASSASSTSSTEAVSIYWIALLLGAATFLVYWPSLSSGFIYDSTEEIKEGFFTSLANLPDVLTLKVLGMPLLLGDRPGQLLYLMLIAAVCGTDPSGYHFCSNLLHAANVALLYVFLSKLTASEIPGLSNKQARCVPLAVGGVTLIFALHPLAVEAVAAVNYSSDPLVVFFTLMALLSATAFDLGNPYRAWLFGLTGTFCAFAAVMCKESGAAACALLVVYWFLFRHNEGIKPWIGFLGAAIVVTVAFIAARFLLAVPAPDSEKLSYLGGSVVQVFLIQPRLWVFMMGKILWPISLSADYQLTNVTGLTLPVAFAILVSVLIFQAWLATKSRLGAMGWPSIDWVSSRSPISSRCIARWPTAFTICRWQA